RPLPSCPARLGTPGRATQAARPAPSDSGSPTTRAGLRLQFDVPVEVVQPAPVQVVRRKAPAALLELVAGGPARAAPHGHARLLGRAAAFPEIAGGAGGDDVLPGRSAAARAGDDVVEGQVLAAG